MSKVSHILQAHALPISIVTGVVACFASLFIGIAIDKSSSVSNQQAPGDFSQMRQGSGGDNFNPGMPGDFNSNTEQQNSSSLDSSGNST